MEFRAIELTNRSVKSRKWSVTKLALSNRFLHRNGLSIAECDDREPMAVMLHENRRKCRDFLIRPWDGDVHLFGLRIELSGREGRMGRSLPAAVKASRFHHPTNGWSCASITTALGKT